MFGNRDETKDPDSSAVTPREIIRKFPDCDHEFTYGNFGHNFECIQCWNEANPID